MIIKRKTSVKITFFILVAITIAQFMLKLGGGKGIFRYAAMYVAVYGRLMFSASMLGYESENHMWFDIVPFCLSMVLFFNLNSNAQFIWNVRNIIIVAVLELIVLGIYKYYGQLIYEIEVDNDN